VPWDQDEPDLAKAYVLACLSELAYMHLTKHELEARDRYKLFVPSIANFELKRLGVEFPVSDFSGPADLGIDVVETLRYVYLVIRFRGAWVIAVRGTHSFSDLLVDLRATKLRATGHAFHKGFAMEALKARPLLQDKVNDESDIYFTGHSMGAAVAAILPHIWCGDNRLMTPYLFAPPRFEGRATDRPLRSYSYVRPSDVVPHLPFLVLGYADPVPAARTVPCSSPRRSGFRCAFATLWQRFATHSIEGYRAGLGRELASASGRAFDEDAYLELIRAL
jgi:hypothetical protein